MASGFDQMPSQAQQISEDSVSQISTELVETPYEYSPLSGDEIRLFQIEPSDYEDDQIRASLVHMRLRSTQAVGYTALSYTWGEANASESVTIDNKTLAIRPNLSAILRRLRSLAYKLLWIDAVCINQGSPRERSDQVIRMKAIYSGAGSVVVSTGATIEPLNELSRLLSLISPVLEVGQQDPQVYTILNDESMQDALVWLSRDEYWKRIWIIQEFAIGSSIELLIGNCVISSKKLGMLIRILHTQGLGEAWHGIDVIFSIRDSWQKDTPFRLLDLLYRTRKSRCQRRHDRLFGVLGLVQDGLKYLPEPNYEASLEDIAMSITRSYIVKYSLDIILLGSHHPASLALPSWSADFFRFDRWPPEERVVDGILNPQSRTTGVTQADVSFQGSALLSSARHVGGISSLGMIVSDPEGSAYPMHNDSFERHIKCSQIVQELGRLLGGVPDRGILREYIDIRALSLFALSKDLDSSFSSDQAKWIRGNRDFFTGVQTLHRHASEISLLRCELSFNVRHVWPYNRRMAKLWHKEDIMPYVLEKNMRLMLVDSEEVGMGWAQQNAQLNDQVFVIPGCSVPVILRRRQDGTYHLIGDAFIPGADGLWKNTKAEDLVHVKIV
ncbi:HET-domain-containing protein [Lophiostoma macrostomum CBS 122681]|uniref:HET-domain-containing protein n=1 Tax=Lophiostoma macrostomum CBS 122681 TaxID=1314788 RepID=A0A6A6TU94_9PLEO|nr:HET-domain-containing protein [Lophiostoma macrostomum CBS 122681]